MNGIDQRGRRAAVALLEAADRLAPPGLGELRRRRRRRSLVRGGLAAAAVVVAAALVGQALPALRSPATTPASRAWPGVPGLDPRVRDAVATGPTCRCVGDVAGGPAGVWVLRASGGGGRARLLRVDPQTDEVVAATRILQRVSYVVAGGDGTAWVARLEPTVGDDEELLQINAAGSIIRAIPLPAIETGGRVEAMVAAGGAVWIADSAGRLLRVDIASGQIRTAFPPSRGHRIVGLAAAGGGIWVASHTGFQRLHPGDGRVSFQVTDPTLQRALPADGLAAGAGALWLVGGGGQLVRVDPVSGLVVGSLELRRPGRAGQRAAVVAADERIVVVRRGGGLFVVAGDGSRVRGYLELPGADGGWRSGVGRSGRPILIGGGCSGSSPGGEGRPARSAGAVVNRASGAERRTPRPGREVGSGR